MSTAVDVPRVEVVAGLDAAQVMAAFFLHEEWAKEKGYRMDAESWEDQMRNASGSGRFMLWVAYDGSAPIGVAEMHLVYDAMTKEWAAFGERAYVLREYRHIGVFEEITKSMIAFADGIGCRVQRMSAEVDGVGRGLQEFYSRFGFKPVSVLMGRG